MKYIASASVALEAVVSFAEVPDVTSTLEFIGNSNLKRWTQQKYTNDGKTRAAIDLQFYRGRLYCGGGEVESNPGPCSVYSIDPDSRTDVFEYSAGTEEIAGFHVMSWGDLAFTSEDPHENDPHIGHVFSRGPESGWTAHTGIGGAAKYWTNGNEASPSSVNYNTHSWDMIEHDGRVFIAGYGISATTDRFATFSNASTCLQTGGNVYHIEYSYNNTSGGGTSYYLLERQNHFVKVGDELFSVYNGYYQPFIARNTKKNFSTLYPNANIGKGMWYNETTKQFEYIDTDLQTIYPGLTSADFALSCGLTMTNSIANQKPTDTYFTARMRIWRPVPFKGRCLYIACVDNESISAGAGNLYKYTSYPLSVAGYTATTAAGNSSFPHKFAATKLDFGGAFPMDLTVIDDVCYALTTHFDTTDNMVEHGIWKSTDGETFTEIATFKFHQNFISLEYRNGYFYVGAGFKHTRSDYPYNSQKDESGAIYRVRCPVEPLHVVPSVAECTVAHGSVGTIGFRLSAAPSSNITVRASSSLGAGSGFSVAPAQLTFTPSNWNVEQNVTVEPLQATAEWAPDALVVGADSAFDPLRGDFVNSQLASASVFLKVLGPSPKAVYNATTKILTFYYDKSDHAGEGTVYELDEKGTRVWGVYANSNWNSGDPAATNVTFDASFKNFKPTDCGSWFARMGTVKSFTGFENLDTSAVTSFNRMFYFAENADLKVLDLSGFDMSSAENISQMFSYCRNVETIYVGDGWNLSKVTSYNNIFTSCTKLVGGGGTAVYTDNVANYPLNDKTYARVDNPPDQPGFFTAKQQSDTPGNPDNPPENPDTPPENPDNPPSNPDDPPVTPPVNPPAPPSGVSVKVAYWSWNSGTLNQSAAAARLAVIAEHDIDMAAMQGFKNAVGTFTSGEYTLISTNETNGSSDGGGRQFAWKTAKYTLVSSGGTRNKPATNSTTDWIVLRDNDTGKEFVLGSGFISAPKNATIVKYMNGLSSLLSSMTDGVDDDATVFFCGDYTIMSTLPDYTSDADALTAFAGKGLYPLEAEEDLQWILTTDAELSGEVSSFSDATLSGKTGYIVMLSSGAPDVPPAGTMIFVK